MNLLDSRMMLMTRYKGLRRKVQATDGNHIDTMFIDKRDESVSGNGWVTHLFYRNFIAFCVTWREIMDWIACWVLSILFDSPELASFWFCCQTAFDLSFLSVHFFLESHHRCYFPGLLKESTITIFSVMRCYFCSFCFSNILLLHVLVMALEARM